MRILLSCALLAACGPIYPQQQTGQPAPDPQPAQAAGPPGMPGASPSDPYDPARHDPPTLDEWAPRTQSQAPIGHAGAFDEPPPPQPAPRPPAPVPRPQGPQPPLSSDTQQLVDAHNAARAKHCAAPLTWSPQLAAAAQRWANSLRDHDCAFEHSPNNKSGENLAGGTAGYLDPTGVVAMWYGEVSKYDFRHPGFSMNTGHFTQVVWRGTTQLGCARATCSAQNQDIWVCEYDPAGNWEGQYPANVQPTGCR